VSLNLTISVLDYSEGRISEDEYNEKMGEMAGEQLFDLATMGVGKGKQIVKAAEEGTTALKTTFRGMATKGDNAVGNLKRSISETTKPFEKFSFGELRNKVRSQMDKGYTKAEARSRIEGGQVCFVAGTMIHTKDGEKKIEDIREGDEVLSYDEQNKTFEYKPVVRTFEKHSDEILSVKIASENEPLGVTPEHPFYARYDCSERRRNGTQPHEKYLR
jgi:hypothetical protein